MFDPVRFGAMLESVFERALFLSRWLLAPFYAGLVLALCGLLAAFTGEIWSVALEALEHGPGADMMTLAALSLIDLSLTANLVLLIAFSGYEYFVSKIDAGRADTRPPWLGKLDFSALKLKLMGSIVAISAIALLRAFLGLGEGEAMDSDRLTWLVVLHCVFVASGLGFALTDRVGHGGHGNE